MTLCRKCGKEIPDGQELCEQCRNTTVEFDESYLNELMKNMGTSPDDSGDGAVEEPMPENEIAAMMDELSDNLETSEENEEGEPVLQNMPELEEPEPEAEEVPSDMEELPLPELDMEAEEAEAAAEEEELPPEPEAEEVPLDMEELPLPEFDMEAEEAEAAPEEEEVPPEPEAEEVPLDMEELPLPEFDMEAEEAEAAPEEEEPLPEMDLSVLEEFPLPDIEPGEDDSDGGLEISHEEIAELEKQLASYDLGDDDGLPESDAPDLLDEELVIPDLDLELGTDASDGIQVQSVAPQEPEAVTGTPPVDEQEGEEDIGHLLDMLSRDYEDDFDDEGGDEFVMPESDAKAQNEPVAMIEPSLFADEDEEHIFADGKDDIVPSKSATVDGVYQDALSAVEYSKKEGADDVPFALDDMAADAEMPAGGGEGGKKKKSRAKKAKKAKEPKTPGEKPDAGFFKRIFGNIITNETAEIEARERAKEEEEAAQKEKLKEENKQKLAAEKEEKAELAKAEKERKAKEKQEQAEEKKAKKEEKKRLKLEQEANEVVGKINPVGAGVVMGLFGILCLGVIFGTRVFSYSSAVKNAEDNLKAGNFLDAYNAISGVDISESSEKMAEKVRICMQLQKELNSYSNYYKMQLYLEALDSLMKGMRRYDDNRSKAEEYEVIAQFDALKNQISSILKSEFGVDETKAREINTIEDRIEYTETLRKIVDKWSAKMREDER